MDMPLINDINLSTAQHLWPWRLRCLDHWKKDRLPKSRTEFIRHGTRDYDFNLPVGIVLNLGKNDPGKDSYKK